LTPILLFLFPLFLHYFVRQLAKRAAESTTTARFPRTTALLRTGQVIHQHHLFKVSSQRDTRLETREGDGCRRVVYATTEHCGRSQGAVPVPKQHCHGLGKAVGSGNVKGSVSVEVRQHQLGNEGKRGAVPLGEHAQRREVSVAIIQHDFGQAVFFNREVCNPIVVEVTHFEVKEDRGEGTAYQRGDG